MKLVSMSNPAGAGTPEARAPVVAAPAIGSDKAPGRPLAVGKSKRALGKATGGVALESIIGADERTRILDTDGAPWRMVCALEIEGPWGNFTGTGWFAGPRTVITAGHLVHDAAQMGGWATRITVTPGRDQTDKPFGTLVSTAFSSTDKWVEAQNPDFDFAAIHLDAADAVDAGRGWFAIGAYADAELLEALVNISGYPLDRGSGTEQWWARNRIKAVTARRIFYDVDTMGGQSGAPAYIVPQAGAAPVVVGIHAYGDEEGNAGLNSAPRVIPEVAEQIAAWVARDSEVAGAPVQLCAATDWSPARMSEPWPLPLKP